MEINQDIVIVGAGVAGLTTSLALHRLGFRSLILESSENLRVSGYGLVLTANAWKALDVVGVGDSLRQHHPQMHMFQAIPIESGIPSAVIPLLKDEGLGKCGYQELRCVKRKSLLENLEKELPSGTIRFSSKLVSIQESGYFKLLHLADGSIIKAKVLIGCDGVNSMVAKWLGLSTPICTQQVCIRGLAEFPDGHGLQPIITQRYGKGIRYGVVPCDDTSVYWWFTFASSEAKEDIKEDQGRIKQLLIDKLCSIFPQSKLMIDKTNINTLSICSLKMRWALDILLSGSSIHKGNVCVAGDAFHPMTPEIGQGGCLALEDGVVLARCLGEALMKPVVINEGKGEEEIIYGRFEKGLEKYVNERRVRSFMVSATSYLMGKLQQTNGKLMGLLIETILSKMLTNTQVKITKFDCGWLNHS